MSVSKLIEFELTTSDENIGESLDREYYTGTATFKYGDYEIESIDFIDYDLSQITPYDDGNDISYEFNNEEKTLTLLIYSPLSLATFIVPIFINGTFQTVDCIVAFDSDGGTPVYPISIPEGEPIGNVPTTSKEGYKFKGWYDSEGNILTSVTIIKSNIAYIAKWVKIGYIDVYNENTWISGNGDSESRTNEITGDNLAVYRDYVLGYNSFEMLGGILSIENHDFNCEVGKDTIYLTDGYAFVYGYFAYHEAKEITFFLPAVEQYYLVYLEFDKSQIPNKLSIKVKNNYGSPNVGKYSFRQDQLSTVKTGVYQMPLWLLKITNQGIESDLIDLRPKYITPSGYNQLIDSIEKVEITEKTNTVLKNGYLTNGVIATSQPTEDNSTKVATTDFVHRAIIEEINK